MSRKVMSKRKYRQQERQRKRAAAQKALRDEFGYTALHEAGRRSQRPDFPDLTTPQPSAPTTALFGPTPAPRPLPPDAKQFPVGNSHKQGPMLITSFDDLSNMGGKKT